MSTVAQEADTPGAQQSHFMFVVPVWGEQYTELFCEVCLPLILTDNNLVYFKDDSTAEFVIATTFKDSNTLRRASSFQTLEKLMKVRLILIDGLVDLRNPHGAMSDCYRFAMELPEVVPATTNFVFLTPDSFWSDGSFRRLYELKQEGYKVVMVLGLRLCLEKARPALMNIVRQRRNLRSDGATLVRLAMQNLHPMSMAHNWFSETGFLNVWPSHIYWMMGKESLMAHGFHLHPLMVRAPKRRVRIGTTIDGEFLARLPFPKRSFYVVQDSNEITGLELSTETRSWNQPLSCPSLRAIQKFSVFHASPLHWMFFGRRIVFRPSADYRVPAELEDHADRILRKIHKFKPISIVVHHLRKGNPVFSKIGHVYGGCQAYAVAAGRRVKQLIKRRDEHQAS